MRHRVLLLLGTMAAVTACESAPPTEARPRIDGEVTIRRTGTANSSAVGAVRFTFGATVEDLAFVVSNNGSSVTTGFALFYSHSADVVAAINVTCLNVSGNTATFLGTIVESSDPNIEGNDAYWQVVDGTPDQSSLVSLAEGGFGPSCETPGEFDLVNITAGIIEVN